MVPGAALMLLFVLVAGHFYNVQDPAEQLAFKARRVDLVGRRANVPGLDLAPKHG
jgi:hypothetical protein